MIFDTHAHYDDRKFNADRDELLKRLKENGSTTIYVRRSGCRMIMKKFIRIYVIS